MYDFGFLLAIVFTIEPWCKTVCLSSINDTWCSCMVQAHISI